MQEGMGSMLPDQQLQQFYSAKETVLLLESWLYVPLTMHLIGTTLDFKRRRKYQLVMFTYFFPHTVVTASLIVAAFTK